jgi:hypothetical protein
MSAPVGVQPTSLPLCANAAGIELVANSRHGVRGNRGKALAGHARERQPRALNNARGNVAFRGAVEISGLAKLKATPAFIAWSAS